jgi:hypothetical protein
VGPFGRNNCPVKDLDKWFLINENLRDVADDLDIKFELYQNDNFPFKGVWIDFKNYVNKQRVGGLDIRINRDDLRIELKINGNLIEFYLNEDNNILLLDHMEKLGSKGISASNIAGGPSTYLKPFAEGLNDILEDYLYVQNIESLERASGLN